MFVWWYHPHRGGHYIHTHRLTEREGGGDSPLSFSVRPLAGWQLDAVIVLSWLNLASKSTWPLLQTGDVLNKANCFRRHLFIDLFMFKWPKYVLNTTLVIELQNDTSFSSMTLDKSIKTIVICHFSNHNINKFKAVQYHITLYTITLDIELKLKIIFEK